MPSTSKSQQRLFGMVHAYQKGKLKHAPAKVREIASHISEEDAKHFAKTRHDGLPERRDREEEKAAAYRAGFLSKCVEYGLGGHDAMRLLKLAAPNSNETYMDRSAGIGPVVDPGNEAMDWLHDGGVNVARVGMNLARPFAWLGDRAAGVFGHNSNLQGRLQAARPQYRNESLETNPMNTGIVNFATGATGAALVAGTGLPNLAAKGLAYLGANAASPTIASAATASVPAVNAAGNALSFAFPAVNSFNAYHDQVRDNQRAAEDAKLREKYGPNAAVLRDGSESAFDKTRHAVNSAVNWAGGTDPYSLAGNMSSM